MRRRLARRRARPVRRRGSRCSWRGALASSSSPCSSARPPVGVGSPSAALARDAPDFPCAAHPALCPRAALAHLGLDVALALEGARGRRWVLWGDGRWLAGFALALREGGELGGGAVHAGVVDVVLLVVVEGRELA